MKTISAVIFNYLLNLNVFLTLYCNITLVIFHTMIYIQVH